MKIPRPPYSPENPRNGWWLWYYRLTIMYIAVMVTIAVILLYEGLN